MKEKYETPMMEMIEFNREEVVTMWVMEVLNPNKVIILQMIV